jgi:Tfp pilus assembly protein PilF
MTTASTSRRDALEKFLQENPNDAFARYGLALDCMNGGDTASAEKHFRILLEKNPDYVPGYLMFGQLLARLQKNEDAREVFTRGMSAARKAGNTHAFNEMENFLLELGR